MTQLPNTISKARARLLVRAPFFGSIALGLAWVNAPGIATMATDGRSIWFNPAWCEKHGVERIMEVTAHEVLHVVNKHHLRRGTRDPRRMARLAQPGLELLGLHVAQLGGLAGHRVYASTASWVARATNRALMGSF